MELKELGMRAKAAAAYLNNLGVNAKNEGLKQVASALMEGADDIIAANKKDVERAKANGMSPALVDRLELNEARVKGMADGLLEVVALEDPVGEVLSDRKSVV